MNSHLGMLSLRSRKVTVRSSEAEEFSSRLCLQSLPATWQETQEPLLDRPVASLIGLAITLIEPCYLFSRQCAWCKVYGDTWITDLVPRGCTVPQKTQEVETTGIWPSPSLKLSLLSPTSLESPWGQNQVSEQTFWASRAWEARIQLSG